MKVLGGGGVEAAGEAGQSVFNWLCRLEGQRSRAQHAAVTLHYSHRPHNERPHNQLPTDPSFKPHTHTHLLTHTGSVGSNQTHTLPSSRLFLSASCALAHVRAGADFWGASRVSSVKLSFCSSGWEAVGGRL